MDCKKVIEELKDIAEIEYCLERNYDTYEYRHNKKLELSERLRELKKQSNLSKDDFINLKKAFNVSIDLDLYPKIQEEIDEDQEIYTDEQMEHFIAHLNN